MESLYIKANTDNLKEILLNTKHNTVIYLPKGFYKGPFEINKPIKLIGEGKETILFNDDIILYINSDNVELENLKLEKTINHNEKETIVKVSNIVKNKPKFKNIIIKGYVKEDDILWEKYNWNIPKEKIYLGKFYNNEISEKIIDVTIKEKCLIESKSEYIKIISKILYPGPQELIIQIKINESIFNYKKIEDKLIIKTEKEEIPINLLFEIYNFNDNKEFISLIENLDTIDNDIIKIGFIFNFSKKSALDFINDNLDLKNNMLIDPEEEIAEKILFKLFNNHPILFYVQYINNTTKYGDKIYKFIMASDNKNYRLPDSFSNKIYEFYTLIDILNTKNRRYSIKIISFKKLSRIFGRKPKNSLSILIDPKLNENSNLKYLIDNLESLPLTEEDSIDISNIENFKLWESYLSILTTIAEKSQYIIKFESNNHGSDPLFITFKINLNEAYIYQNENIIKFIDTEDLLRRLKSSINSYINLINDSTLYQYSESSIIELGVVSNFDETNLLLTIELNDELYEENKKGLLQIPKSGFLYNNSKGDIVQIKRQQNALEFIQKGLSINPKLHEFIFDSSKAKPIKNYTKLGKEELLLKHIFDNKEQKEAVEIALSCEDLALIQGPPGTGKTTVIAEICYQMAKKGQRVLISSQTNLAVDNALSKLVHQPIIRPLRLGKAKSIAEEGLVFLEENIIDKWLKDTSNYCKTRLEKKINLVNTFKTLFDSKEKIKEYIKKEKNVSNKIYKLKILSKETKYKIGELNKNITYLENEISTLEKEYEIILEALKDYNYLLNNFQDIFIFIKQNLENNNTLTNFINEFRKIELEINKNFNYDNYNDFINIFLIILKKIVYDIEIYSDVKSLINHIINLIKEKSEIEIEINELNIKKNKLDKLKIKYLKDKEELNKNLFNIILTINSINNKSKIINEKKSDFESYLIKNLKNFLTDKSYQYSEIFNIIKKYISFSNNMFLENITSELGNKIISYFEKIRFRENLLNIKKELEEVYNKKINNISQSFIDIKSLEDKDFLNYLNSNFNIEKLIEIKNKLISKIEYYLSRKNKFFNIFFNNLKINVKLSLSKLKQLIEFINSKIIFNEKPFEEFIKETTNNFINDMINYFNNLVINNNEKKVILEKKINELISKIKNIENELEKMNLEIAKKEEIKNQKEVLINKYTNELVLIFNKLELFFKISLENLSTVEISNFLINLNKTIENIKNLSFTNILSNIKTIFDKKVLILKKELLNKNQKIKFLISKNLKINKIIEKINLNILELRNWWQNIWESIPERLKNDFNIKDINEIYKIDFLEKVLLLIESWKKEYEKELIYINKYKNIIENWCERILNPNDFDRKQLKEIYIKNANVIGCTCSYAGSKEFNEYYGDFDAVIIDEMSKVSPPELLIPAIHGKKIILIGDHKQLPPFLNDFCTEEMIDLFNLDKEAIENMKQSLFKKLYLDANDSIKKMLVIQYRMHPHIMTAINQFYDEKLECNFELLNEKRQHNINDELISNDIHLLWIDFPIKKEYYSQKQVYSYFNISEINAIKIICERINSSLEKQNKIKEVAIITFYSAQNKLIEEEILKKNEFKNLKLKIGTVDRFQGMESPIVIVSMVHNNPDGYIGFAQEYERINVAFSRAQELLIIVGCSTLFCEKNLSTKAKIAYSNVRNKVKKYGKIINASEL